MRIRLEFTLAVFLAACMEPANGLRGEPAGQPVRRGSLVEVPLTVTTELKNPFDPGEISVDVELASPSGVLQIIPAFYRIPFEADRETPPERIVWRLKLFVPAKDWKPGTELELLLDDLELVDRETDEKVTVADFEGELKWRAEGAAQVSLVPEEEGAEGKALKLSLTTPEKGWPGASSKIPKADWTRFDEVRCRVKPIQGFQINTPVLEFLTTDGVKRQAHLTALAGQPAGKWVNFVWKLPHLSHLLKWHPTGEGKWAFRIRPREEGVYRYRVRQEGAKGLTLSSWKNLPVGPGRMNGYVQISRGDRRYLALDAGQPLFLVGINLLGSNLPDYEYYLDKLSSHGGNFIRLWLSPRTLGIETRTSGPMRYAQDRAARLDALFQLCEQKGIYVMACITDFREVNSFHEGAHWPESTYNQANGGPCANAEDFFTDPRAKQQYRAKLRYLVARYGHSPNLLSWEFFNEVNITDGWRNIPGAVRQWHREMAEYLRGIDPQHHLITSSFAGIEDDALWSQPLMEIVQRHHYMDDARSFADVTEGALGKLRAHEKPLLIGEFGRRKNRYGDRDSRGVSLHNGLWAALFSGSCGTAMSWWWQWIDAYNLWTEFQSVARFTAGIQWSAEVFRTTSRAGIAAKPDPSLGFGKIVFKPECGGFQPAPCNRPISVRVSADGKIDDPKLLPIYLHGLKHHRDLHNPLTFVVNFPRPTIFSVLIGDVSGFGGATLQIRKDDQDVINESLSGHPEGNKMVINYNRRYEVDIPAGEHAFMLENRGIDWIRVRAYEFGAARPTPPVQVRSLIGKTQSLVWVRNETYTWFTKVYDAPVLRLTEVMISLDGFRPGTYRSRRFNTRSGAWSKPQDIIVPETGALSLDVGDLFADAAYRLERIR